MSTVLGANAATDVRWRLGEQPVACLARPARACVGDLAWSDDVWHLFVECGIKSAPVVDDGGRPIGAIHLEDIERYRWRDDLDGAEDGWLSLWLPQPGIAGEADAEGDPVAPRWRVRRLMRPEIATLTRGTPLWKAAALFQEQQVQEIALVDDAGVLAGLVSVEDLERALRRAKPRRILVADDDPVIRQTLGEILSDEGYEVTLADNGRAAESAVRADRPPDLIVLDLMMPVMSGWDFLELLESDDHLAPVPVIVISALPHAPVATAACRDVRRWFNKPLDVRALLDAVRTYSAGGTPPAANA